jgi:hypothetical protein
VCHIDLPTFPTAYFKDTSSAADIMWLCH